MRGSLVILRGYSFRSPAFGLGTRHCWFKFLGYRDRALEPVVHFADRRWMDGLHQERWAYAKVFVVGSSQALLMANFSANQCLANDARSNAWFSPCQSCCR